MSDDMIALSRRAVECRGWRWMPGTSYWWCKSQHRVADEERGTLRTDGSLLPDLTDPATLGCLLALVREAWESPKANISWVTDDNCMVVFDPRHAQRFLLQGTEAEALVAALESAP